MRKKNSFYPIIEYTNTANNINFNTNYFGGNCEDKSNKFSILTGKNFITENVEIKKNILFDSQNIQLFDIEKYEKKFNTHCENKFKKWCIRMKTKSSVKNEIISEMKNYYKAHKIDNDSFDKQESIQNNNLTKTKVTICLANINLFYQKSYFDDFIKFFDLFSYSMNLSGIFTNSIRKINRQLKIKSLKIFDLTYNDKFVPQENTQNVFVLDISAKSVNLMNIKDILSLKDINEFSTDRESLYKVINNSSLRMTLHNLIGLVYSLRSDYKEILFSIENAKLLLKKKDYKKETILKSSAEEGFNYILYKGTQEEKVNIMTVVMKIKEKSENDKENDLIYLFFNQDFNEKHLILYCNYLDFLGKNLIKANDLNIKVYAILNQVVVSLFYEQFDINHMVELFKEWTQSEEQNDQLFDRTIDFKKHDLFTLKKVSY